MSSSYVELSNIIESKYVKTFRNIISRIGKNYSYKEIGSSAGFQLQAIPEQKVSNLPQIRLILNFLGEITTVRFEATGNLSHYVIEEIITKSLDQLNPIEIELTELHTGRIRIQLNKRKFPSNRLYPLFLKDFNTYYANDEGRLLILLDDEPDPASSIAISADPLKIRPKTSSYVTRPAKSRVTTTNETISGQRTEIKSDLTESDLSDFQTISEAISSKIPMKEEEIESKDIPIPDLENKIERTIKTKGRKKKKRKTSSIISTDEVEERPITSEIEKSRESPVSVKDEQQTATTNEKLVLNLIDKKPKRKVQSKGLKKELANMEQAEIKDILRSLVSKGFLYVQAAWYIRKDPDEKIVQKSKVPLDTRLKKLNTKEKKIYDILNKREGLKAQARMLMKGTKMSKDNLKKILRDMVAKDVLYVEAAWYIILD
ncbi:MAG: hypothetical protein HeimC3_27000 [Candidatus Heimdallarchaeota archaeon LC_3]|nr:MAG: hypothetical protein HeimC3_27000 [Candidatus Heimdallarchaeota archaeon LC_3]